MKEPTYNPDCSCVACTLSKVVHDAMLDVAMDPALLDKNVEVKIPLKALIRFRDQYVIAQQVLWDVAVAHDVMLGPLSLKHFIENLPPQTTFTMLIHYAQESERVLRTYVGETADYDEKHEGISYRKIYCEIADKLGLEIKRG